MNDRFSAAQALRSLCLRPATPPKELFAQLNTLRRPALPDGDEFCFRDWVLVWRRGVELGSRIRSTNRLRGRFRWGFGRLLLTQSYFYSGFDDVPPFTGALPFALHFSDERESARMKLAAFEDQEPVLGCRHCFVPPKNRALWTRKEFLCTPRPSNHPQACSACARPPYAKVASA